MKLTPTLPSHLPAIKALHAASGYEHVLPPDETLRTGFVAIIDGEVEAWIGCEKTIQAYFITNTKLPPKLRVELLKCLTMRMADYVTHSMPWVKSAFVWVDANYPKTAKRLIQMGFAKPVGELLELTRARALEILVYLKELAA
jgi:hypothetical protein